MWAQKKILITIKTYPEVSSKYTEKVCTGGILADSRKLVRPYPVRYRYLDGDSKFKKYQWITAEIKKATDDNRPESYKLKEGSIVLGEEVDTKDSWRKRKEYVLSDKNVYDSLEALSEARESSGVSLGLVKPRKVDGFKVVHKTPDELREAGQKKQSVMQQLSMFEDRMDLDLLPVRFVLGFHCKDERCDGHNLSILDWEIGELYRRVRHKADSDDLVEQKVLREICGDSRETLFFLGNMHRHQHVFCILGFFWPPKEQSSMQEQLGLF